MNNFWSQNGAKKQPPKQFAQRMSRREVTTTAAASTRNDDKPQLRSAEYIRKRIRRGSEILIEDCRFKTNMPELAFVVSYNPKSQKHLVRVKKTGLRIEVDLKKTNVAAVNDNTHKNNNKSFYCRNMASYVGHRKEAAILSQLPNGKRTPSMMTHSNKQQQPPPPPHRRSLQTKMDNVQHVVEDSPRANKEVLSISIPEFLPESQPIPDSEEEGEIVDNPPAKRTVRMIDQRRNQQSTVATTAAAAAKKVKLEEFSHRHHHVQVDDSSDDGFCEIVENNTILSEPVVVAEEKKPAAVARLISSNSNSNRAICDSDDDDAVERKVSKSSRAAVCDSDDDDAAVERKKSSRTAICDSDDEDLFANNYMSKKRASKKVFSEDDNLVEQETIPKKRKRSSHETAEESKMGKRKKKRLQRMAAANKRFEKNQQQPTTTVEETTMTTTTTTVQERKYVGKRVAKYFGHLKDRKLFFGSVVHSDDDFWHVVYDDDDREDLEYKDVQAAVNLYEKRKRLAFKDPLFNNKIEWLKTQLQNQKEIVSQYLPSYNQPTIGFAPRPGEDKKYTPVIFLSPYDLDYSHCLRKEWFTQFGKMDKTKKVTMPRLVYFYGHPNDKPEFAMVKTKDCLTYEQGEKIGLSKLPNNLDPKFLRRDATAWTEMLNDMLAPHEKIRLRLPPKKEGWEMVKEGQRLPEEIVVESIMDW